MHLCRIVSSEEEKTASATHPTTSGSGTHGGGGKVRASKEAPPRQPRGSITRAMRKLSVVRRAPRKSRTKAHGSVAETDDIASIVATLMDVYMVRFQWKKPSTFAVRLQQ